MVYVSMDYFGTFQTKMWVDLRWCAHSGLCKLYKLKMIFMFHKLLYHVFDVFFNCRKIWPKTKMFL
jgi:hypothetical protein